MTETTTPATPTPTEAVSTRPGPRWSTLSWAIILLVVAGLALTGALVDPALLTGTVVLWGIAAVGGLIVLGAIVAAIIRAAANRS